LNGWIACTRDDYPDLHFVHLRPMGSSRHSIYAGRMRHGYGQYFMGTGLFFFLASAIYRIPGKPYVLGGLAILWGWLRSALRGLPRYDDPDFRKFLRSYQMRALMVVKKKAIEEIHLRKEALSSRQA
jgi:poly-beta-1,6-N-acetyl-D-glucosamine synthase